MHLLIEVSVVLLGYILGSIPFGLVFVKLIAGKDVRDIASGRTGGTNAARAGGAGVGLLTAVADGAKATVAVWLAIAVLPASHWVHVLAPIAAILGHNYSMFIVERDEKNRIRLRGGAGGGPTVGGAIGLWWPSAFIVMPLAALVFFGIGYASVTTLSIAIIVTIIFVIRHSMGLATWPDVYYGIIAFCLLAWALRPNIKALIEGREQFHGWRPWRKSGEAVVPGSEASESSAMGSKAATKPASRRGLGTKKANGARR